MRKGYGARSIVFKLAEEKIDTSENEVQSIMQEFGIDKNEQIACILQKRLKDQYQECILSRQIPPKEFRHLLSRGHTQEEIFSFLQG